LGCVRASPPQRSAPALACRVGSARALVVVAEFGRPGAARMLGIGIVTLERAADPYVLCSLRARYGGSTPRCAASMRPEYQHRPPAISYRPPPPRPREGGKYATSPGEPRARVSRASKACAATRRPCREIVTAFERAPRDASLSTYYDFFRRETEATRPRVWASRSMSHRR
jgi:hypothetical protein